MNFGLNEILTIIEEIKKTDFEAFEYQDADTKIKIRGRKSGAASLQEQNLLTSAMNMAAVSANGAANMQNVAESMAGFNVNGVTHMQNTPGSIPNLITNGAVNIPNVSGNMEGLVSNGIVNMQNPDGNMAGIITNGNTNTPSAMNLSQTTDSTDSEHMVDITSPMVGTFYAAPSEDAKAFVQVGDTVKKGQTVCIVEAMKLMNEIPSEVDGIVEAVLVENEDLVEFGQPLVRVRTI